MEEEARIRASIPQGRIREAVKRSVRGDFSALAQLYEETRSVEYADPYYRHRFETAETATEKVRVLDEYITVYPGIAATFPWYRNIERVIPSLREAARSEQEANRSQDPDAQLPERLRRGKRCYEVVQEIRKIKNMRQEYGRTVAEVQTDNPEFHVWKILPSLPQEDQEQFQHPRQWGPVVGHAHSLLSKHYGLAPDTIRDWIKEYRAWKKKGES